jgi:hypothetical protein
LDWIVLIGNTSVNKKQEKMLKEAVYLLGGTEENHNVPVRTEFLGQDLRSGPLKY